MVRFICALLFGAQIAASYACAEVPVFINESIYNSGKAEVSAVDSNLAADLVILDSGLEQGLRRGMVCLVKRDSKLIGELIIIESKSNCSAALILNLTENLTIQSGDSVRIKTFQNS
jgi:hypothetical protein